MQKWSKLVEGIALQDPVFMKHRVHKKRAMIKEFQDVASEATNK